MKNILFLSILFLINYPCFSQYQTISNTNEQFNRIIPELTCDRERNLIRQVMVDLLHTSRLKHKKKTYIVLRTFNHSYENENTSFPEVIEIRINTYSFEFYYTYRREVSTSHHITLPTWAQGKWAFKTSRTYGKKTIDPVY